MPVIFDTQFPFHEMSARAASDIRDYEVAMQSGAEVMWKTWAGDQLPMMMNSPEATNEYMAASEPILRLAAASLVDEYWPANELFATACMHLAFFDTISTIRGAALRCFLYKLHQFVHDPSGIFTQLMDFLRALEADIPRDVVSAAISIAQHGIDEANEAIAAVMAQLAGHELEKMLQSAAMAETYVRHEQPSLRRAALLVLNEHWKLTTDLRGICMRLIREDADVDVRTQAQDILCDAYFRSGDAEIGQLFAQVVQDESEPISLRRHAYVSLFLVRSMPVSRLLPTISGDFRFPEDADWEFVTSFFN